KKTIYCYSDTEKDAAINELKGRAAAKTIEVTRFKGLGEISPPEFKQFIGADMRIKQVLIDNLSEVSQVLKFYMGKNTPDRRKYIMDHLTLRPV
ncbi:MAG: type IIA DNA topoisomerase subunit B, partial [Desulfobulbaceae bacterium]|nr:type IIA DNA topoisomerase subunit B [Desulfobulbaceae bacterium]